MLRGMASVVEAVEEFEGEEDAGEGVEGREQGVCLMNAGGETLKEGERQVCQGLLKVQFY